MKQLSITLLAFSSCAVAALAQTVAFNGTGYLSGAAVTASSSGGSVASQSGLDLDGQADATDVRRTTPYGTLTFTGASGLPTIYGGIEVQAYDTATAIASGAQFALRDSGTNASIAASVVSTDYIRYTASSSPAVSKFAYGSLLFGTGVSNQGLNTSAGTALSLTYASAANTNTTMRYMVYDATLGNYYVSSTTMVHNQAGSTGGTAFSLSGASLSSTTWAAWNPLSSIGSDIPIGTLNYNIATSQFSNVTRVGVYFETSPTGTGGATIDIGAFTAELAAIPEPSTYAVLAGLAALGLVAYRRRQQMPVV